MQPKQDPYAAIMKKYNVTPVAGSGQPVSSADDFNSFMNKTGSYAPAPTPDIVANPFPKSPLENIADGNSQTNLDTSKGAIKQVISDALGAGPESPNNPDSPIGKVNFANAPAFANDVRGLDSAVQPKNAAQEEGARNTSVAEAVLPSIEGASDLVGAAKKGASVFGDAVSAVKSKIGSFFSGKTPEEILATPESSLHKLSAADRQFYFDNQKDAINQSHQAKIDSIDQTAVDTEAKAKTNLQQTNESLQNQTDELNRKVAVSSRDEVLALRPKIQTALGQQSRQYRALVSEELAPHADVAVSHDELAKFIDDKFAADPDKAQAVKSKLGIQETPKGPSTPGSSDQLPSTDFANTTTIGDMYKKTLNLGQEISTGVKKGSKVFSPDEVMTDNAINTLTDFMKSKGVDLSAARQFWAKYAPVRNQLVSEAKPFLQAPTQTKTFANTIVRVAKGADVNNENFISAAEDLVGRPIGGDVRASLTKLSDVEKQQVAAKIDSEVKIAAAKSDAEQAKIAADKTKDAAQKQLEIKQLIANRKAMFRKIVTKAIAGVAGAAVGAGVGSAAGGVVGGEAGAAAGGAIGAVL